jgi:hypothetical protein
MTQATATFSVEQSAEIAASAARAYALVADYRSGHPRMLPPKVFTALEIEAGGIGAGTIIRFQMKTLGRTTTYRAAISEPEPGRRLLETVLDEPIRTTFLVEPLSADACRVTIRTEMPTRSGLFGWAERILATRFLRTIYAEELSRLAALVQASG